MGICRIQTYAKLITMLQTNQPSQIRRQRPAPPRRRSSVNLSWQTVAIIFTALAAAFTLIAVVGFGLLLLVSPPGVAANVSVAGVNLGGLSEQEAANRLRAQMLPQQLRLTDGSRQWVVFPTDLGIGIDLQATVKAAANAQQGAALLPVYTVDLAAAQTGLVALSNQINIEAVPGTDGRSMDIPVMLDRLRRDVGGEVADSIFELNMIQIPAPAQPTTVHVVEQGQELALIARQYGVSTQDILDRNDISDPDLIYPGQQLIIPAAGEYIPENPPAAPTNLGKSIVVSTEDQRIYAYQDGNLVRTHLVSTGLPGTPTVHGDYAIYVKYQATDMSGPDYYLPQVPYTMYFYQGYGIHGTYWHNAFGRPMSHGCVNLPTPEAEWFFNFADVGTPVRVI